MTSNEVARREEPRRTAKAPRRRAANERLGRMLGWIAVVGWVARMFGLRRRAGLLGARRGPYLRRQRRLGNAAIAVSGVTLLALFERGRRSAAAPRAPIEVERSITLGRTPDEITSLLRDPRALERIAGVAQVIEIDQARTHWIMKGKRRTYEWDVARVQDRPGELSWVSLPGAPLEAEVSVRLRREPQDRGTRVTLHARVEPRSAALRGAAGLLGPVTKALATKALRRLGSLAETGEVPRPHGQHAAHDSDRET